MNKAPATINAVLKYVADLNLKADQAVARDPYARPYRINDEAAKRLVRACAQARVLKLDAMCSTAEKQTARDLGPSDALVILALRVIETQADYRAETIAAEHKDARHQRRQRQAARDRLAASQTLSIGQRIDRGLTALSTVSGVTAANLDSDVVTGSKEHGIQTDEKGNAFVDNPAAKAKAIAEEAMRKVENEVEDARRRRVELEAAA